jgi:hypothetical protein
VAELGPDYNDYALNLREDFKAALHGLYVIAQRDPALIGRLPLSQKCVIVQSETRGLLA